MTVPIYERYSALRKENCNSLSKSLSGPILPIYINNTILKNMTKKVTVLVHLSIHRNWKCERTPGLVSAEFDFPGEPVYADCHLVVTEVQV